MGTDKDSKTNLIKTGMNGKSYLVRKCTFDDLEFVKEVNEKELPEDYPFFFYKSILDNYPESFLVACSKDDDNKVIGYVMWRIERTPSKDSLRLVNKGHLVSIAVSQGYRRLGIASTLLNESMPEIKKHNIDEYVLEVRVSNYGAISLYQRFYFKTEGIKKKYYRDGENAYYMVRKVN
ncbi:MAG: N-acetyltransferase [Promethearchaeota archaeon]|nr:MAG: N-acetyltransferase [Candidatus Lokiarchaeota archaeon]